MVIILPPIVIGKEVKIPYEENDHPSKDVRMVGDDVMDGEPRAL